MDLTRDQYTTITELVGHWSKNSQFELETTFGRNHVVDSNTFLQIAQRLTSKQFEKIPQEDYLNIMTPNSGRTTDHNPLRITVYGLGSIESYCKDNVLTGKRFSIMRKSRISPKSPLDIDEYNIRFKLQEEQVLSEDDPSVKSLLKSWTTQPKAFRVIRRWSFKRNGIRVDMSMIRQSPTDSRGTFMWATNFLQHDIFKQVVRYEVEVELLHEDHNSTPEIAIKSLIAGVGEVQRAIQRNTLLIRKSITAKVLQGYSKLVNGNAFRGVKPVTFLLENMTLKIDETVNNIRTGYNVTDKADGMRAMGYFDETGELFLIDQSMNVYRTGLQNAKCKNCLVDGEWVTFDKDGKAINDYLIFDIYIFKGEKVHSLPFIAVIESGIDVEGESRSVKMNKLFKDWTDELQIITKGINENNRLDVSLKQFYLAGAHPTLIFDRCAEVLSGVRKYHTDGLIITSNTEPIPDKSDVAFKHQFKWKPAEENTVDFLINFERDEVDPIDKISTMIHPKTGLTVRYKTMRLYVGGTSGKNGDNPRTIVLSQMYNEEDKDDKEEKDDKDKKNKKEAYRPILFNPYEYSSSHASICYSIIHEDLETSEQFVMTTNTEEPITNNSVVEMRYDPSEEPGWRWIPARIRHDKTERLLHSTAEAKLKNTTINYSGVMNNDMVAKSIWKSIHEPVTVSMISTGAEQPSQQETLATESTVVNIAKKYYERKAPKDSASLVKTMRDFHNRYIKSTLLIQSVLQKPGQRLLDIACGNGNDMYRWKEARLDYVMGIDIAEDNITNHATGIYARYLPILKSSKKYRNYTKMAFAIGNSSQPIVNGECAPNPLERDIIRSVFGRVAPEAAVPPYITNVMKNSFKDGADVVACMFAIHYFFESKQTLDGLLQNLSDTVKVGGYFIGACFDGESVFKLLSTTETDHSKDGIEGDTPIWTITKNYNRDELTGNDDSIGLGITVEFVSIGAAHKEYLVPFDLLVSKMRSIGLELLTRAEANRIGLEHSTAMFSESHEMAKKAKQTYNMPPAVQQFSFLNRWFIFKRKSAAAPSMVPTVFTPEVLPPLPATMDPAIYKHFDKKITKVAPAYAKFYTVESSEYSVLKPWHTKAVTAAYKKWLPSSITHIVDGTAHIGVDSIHMANVFPNAIVDAYEIVPETFVALRVNIATFGKEDKIRPHNMDITLWEPTEQVDLIFVDPPWGGVDFDKVNSLDLYFQAEGDAPDVNKKATTLIKKWLRSGYVKHIILKTPDNFNRSDLPVIDKNDDIIIANRTGKIAYHLLHFTDKSVVEEPADEVKEEVVATFDYSDFKPMKFGSGRLQDLTNTRTSEEEEMKRFMELPEKIGDLEAPLTILPNSIGRYLGLAYPIEIPLFVAEPPVFTTIEQYTADFDAYIKTEIQKKGANNIMFPSIEHYMIAMKLKYATDSPGSAYIIISTNMKTHQEILGKRQAIMIDAKGDPDPAAIYKKEYFDSVLKEVFDFKKLTTSEKIAKIKMANVPNGLVYNEAVWLEKQERFIDFALMYRLKKDTLFANTIKFLIHKKYKLEYALPLLTKKPNANAANANAIQNTVIGSLDKHIGDQIMIYANVL
jgi:SAM-dependent methyltransferase